MSLAALTLKLRTLANPRKIKILVSLREKPLSITEIADKFSMPQSTVRKYLLELETGGYVTKTPDGKFKAKDFKIVLSLDNLVKLVKKEEEQLTPLIVKEHGTEILRKLKELALQVKKGKLSIYDVAEHLGLTYFETYVLLEESGLI